MGEKAAGILRIFAGNFCLPNSFHVNGEQHNQGFSKFKYRPFTLEGNFAFASAIQEMLIQSHTGVVRIFPAIPADWNDVSFNQLRTVGAFLISAEKKKGILEKVEIFAEKGGIIKLVNPFADRQIKGLKNIKEENGILEIPMKPGEKIVLEADK
jgi:alpha-L-fucosidase 2